jgi:hypothetical protein
MSDKELAITINLAGKQRMLIQKMSKEAMLIKLGIDIEKSQKSLKESSTLFDKTLKGLLYGDKDLDLVPIKDKKIRASLQNIEKLWRPFYKKIKDIYQLKNLTDDTFKYIEENNLKLLNEMNKIVYLYADSGTQGDNKLAMANDINLAGKQRMLTQQIAKDLLFYQAGLNRDKALKSIKKSVKLFDKTLKGLFNGDKELKIIGTKLPDIVNQLKVVEKSWKGCKPLIDKAFTNIDNLDLTKKTIECLDKTKNEMDKAVVLYTKSLNRQKQILNLNNLINEFEDKNSRSKHLIDLAGKQRMLTQRIGKLAVECKLHLLKDSCVRLDRFVKLYHKTLVGFKNGDKDLNLLPTESKEALAQIDKLLKMWEPFSKAVMRVQNSNGKDVEAIKYVINNNEKLLQESNKLVSIFEKEHGKNISYIEKAQLHIVNIAGRERMLTQKMTKELLALLYLNMKDFKPKLEKSVKLFNSSLNGLIYGDKKLELPKVTNPKIKKQLLKVKKIWEKIEPLYSKKKLTKKELLTLLKTNPILLREMDKAVKMIAESVDY